MTFDGIDAIRSDQYQPVGGTGFAELPVGEATRKSRQALKRDGGPEHGWEDLVLDGTLPRGLLFLTLGKVPTG